MQEGKENRKSRKKIILNTLLFFVVFGLTLYGVFYGEDIGDINEAIHQSRIQWLFPAIICVLVFYLGRVDHHMVYDAFLRNSLKGASLFSRFPLSASFSAV